MEVEDGVFGVVVLIFEEDGGDAFAVLVGEVEIDSFEEVAVEGLFFGAEMGEIVSELFGVDDAFPGSFVEFGHKVIDIFIEQIIMEVDMIKNSTKKG